MLTRRHLVQAAAAAALFATSAAQADSTGVAEATVKIGVLGSLTGPAAIWGTGNLAGATLAFEEVNAAGGVHGRRIEWVSVDDETSAPKGIAGFRRLLTQDNVFLVFGPTSSAVGVPLLATLRSSNVPVFISAFSSPLMTNPPAKNIFRAGTLNDRDQGYILADYVARISQKKTIAVMRQSDEYGKNGGGNVLERLGRISGVKATEEIFNAADTDFTPQLLRVRDFGADVLVIYGYPAASAIALRQSRQLGLAVQVVGSTAATSRTYPQTVGEAAKGTQAMSATPDMPESDKPAIATFRRAFEARFPDLARQNRPELSDLLAYNGALVVIEGLRRAGQDLSREGFMKSLEELKNFDTGLTNPTTFGPDRREGNRTGFVMQVQDDLSRRVLPTPIVAE